MTDAQICRKKGWKVGDRLRGIKSGVDWWRMTIIQITAIGERQVLAEVIAETGTGCSICNSEELGLEGTWCLSMRKWKKVRG